jgi:hypothetical protein
MYREREILAMHTTDNTIILNEMLFTVDDFETNLQELIEVNYKYITVAELQEMLSLKVSQSQYVGTVLVTRIK